MLPTMVASIEESSYFQILHVYLCLKLLMFENYVLYLEIPIISKKHKYKEIQMHVEDS